MSVITRDQTIAEIVQQHPYSVPVFLRHGLFCFGCAVARYENLEQGAQAHGIDTETLLADLNKAAEENAAPAPATAE